ncbi:hypothetical protein N7492_005655 [Penicillium capsulatum]|uniref:Transglycosylase SLT domain-containing protein n=1 Tax=Penicillium capsulatum TaxID=69766 RepID=A0A9W9IDT3_9EURO|nr:hypothetical protein N7492_005655 [Penicillium capsulatum]
MKPTCILLFTFLCRHVCLALPTEDNHAVVDHHLASPASAKLSQDIARRMINDDEQYQCFYSIVERESNWDYTATNVETGAYGLVQALPGSKMAAAGADWRINPATQIEWGLGYTKDRYNSPCGAWSFWQANRWW